MNNIKIILLPIFAFILIFSACRQESVKFFKGNLTEAFRAAKKENKNLCVIAYKPGCDNCEKYLELIETSVEIKSEMKDYLIYKCNLSQVGNEYISKIAYNIASPSTYVFNSDGVLLNFFMGNRDVDDFLNGALIKKGDVSRQGNPRFDLNNQGFMNLFNVVMNSYQIYQNPISKKEVLHTALLELEKSVKNEPYFYNNYLAAKISALLNNTLKQKKYGNDALEYDDSFSVYLYSNERSELKFLTNQQYTKSNEGYLLFENASIDYGVVPNGSNPKRIFRCKNVGKVPVIIKDVKGSCNCMNINWTKSPIFPNRYGEVEVEYDANQIGGFSKVLFVTSSGVNEQHKLFLTGIVD